jgi:hypothetical protein|tara:strand:- start:2106 stop:2321 length:216 start_codon:yes stop_codon:yes gene_type:complete
MSLKDDALEIRIDLRTCIGHIKNRVVQLEESKARINEQLNIHVGSLLDLHAELKRIDKELMNYLEKENEES